MVKRTITITTILLIISIAISLIIVLNKSSFAADDDIASGTLGTCSWVIDSEGILTISPTDGISGKLPSNSQYAANGPLYSHATSVTKVLINPGVKMVSGYRFFFGFSQCKEIDLSNLDTTELTGCGEMFRECKNLEMLNLGNFDTSRCIDTARMFYQCKALKAIDVSNFDTSNVMYMAEMFNGCESVKELDVSNWNTSNVIHMSSLFKSCTSLTTLDVSNFNTSKVNTMYQMFYGCSNLTSIDVSNFDTSNVENMESLFRGCNKVTELDVSNWNTSKTTTMSSMFQSCSKVTNIDVSRWDTAKVTTMDSMFSGCSKLENLDVSNWNTSLVTNMTRMFNSCYSLKTLDVSDWNVSKVTTMGRYTYDGMFQGCTNLLSLDVSKWNTSSVTDMAKMFSGCSNLKTIDVSNWNLSKVTTIAYMFENCFKIENIDVSKWDTSNVTIMPGVFWNCNSVKELDVSNWNTDKVYSTYYMFSGCNKITELDLSNWNTSIVTTMESMFSGTSSLKTVKLGENFTFNGANISETYRKGRLDAPSTNAYYTGKWIRSDEMYGPYSNDELRDNYDGTTMAGTWIWEKASYTVSYSYTGTVPNGASDLPSNTKYKVETQVAVASDSAAPGYTFSGWSRTGTFEMPAQNVEITGSFTANTDTPYTVEHYLEDITEGSYTLTKTDNLTGITDTEVEATAKDYEGFTFDNTIEGTKQSGNISGDGSLVLKLYYKRNSYNVTYSYTGDVPEAASELPQSKTYKYGEEIKVPEDATAEGYTFSGWIKDYITMPAQDIVITGYFIEEPRLYKIEYYFDNELDEALVEILNAEKDEEINLTPQTPVKHGEKNYTLVSNNHKITISVNDEENVIKVYYETDVLDYAIDEDTTEGDGIPDKYQISITYKVENGSWNDGTQGTKTDIITLKDKDGNLSEEGTGTTTIPEVGNKPNNGYTKGYWNKVIPNKVSSKDDGKEFVYSYEVIDKVKSDISGGKGKSSNPKTDDIVNKYLLVGVGGLLVLALVSKIRRKYSRKAKKVQF